MIKSLGRWIRMVVARFRNDLDARIAISKETEELDDQSHIRRGIVNSLANHPSDTARNYLVDRLNTDTDPIVRMNAALAIGRRPTANGELALVAALNDPDHRVFVAAATSLTRSTEVLRELIKGLGSALLTAVKPRPSAAKIRLIQLCRKGLDGELAREVFLGLAEDGDKDVRLSAIRSLKKVDHRAAVELARRELPAAGFVDSATYKNILAEDEDRADSANA